MSELNTSLLGLAKALPTDSVTTPGMPVPVVLQEAAGVARFVRLYWQPADDGSRPGLVTVESTLPRTIEDEILALIELASEQHVRVLFPGTDNSKRRALVERGEALLARLGAALDYVLDDGVDESIDEAWQAARERDVADGTQAGLAQSLADYAGVADRIRDRLRKLGDFDDAIISEARALSEELFREGPPTVGRVASHEIDLRNRLLMLLSERVSTVRKAARYVFRDHEDIVRLVTSAYERRRRVAAHKSTPDEEQSQPQA